MSLKNEQHKISRNFTSRETNQFLYSLEGRGIRMGGRKDGQL